MTSTAEGAASVALRVLVIDDEKNIRTMLTVCLEESGCTVTAAATAEAALDALRHQPFDLAFLDLRLGTVSGLDVLPKLLAESPQLSVVVVTAYATIETAVVAIKRGATDYLPKPFTPAQIRHVVEQVSERRSAALRVADLEQQLLDAAPEADLTTESPRMRAVRETLTRAASADVAVLLRGENGTGKGVLARALHVQSPRRDHPFVVVNCPTLSDELLASELFGHAKGSFTGAIRDQPGRVEAAQGGTLFLDEIGEISPGLQAKLLRFLQDKEFERVGESLTRHADVRVVAATNRDLENDVKNGRFREDLLYRLNVIELQIPPLRERPEDLLPLANKFLAFFARTAGRATPELSPAAAAALQAYSWPGNIRELRNAIERAVILWPAQVIEPAALPERIAGQSTTAPRLGGDFTLDAIEREHILQIIARTPTLEDAARILGIDSSTLWRKRKRYEEAS
ncbi:MAG TPA: sigma-54 dependent transcriptional regulator [Candidatus Margulisiibacteriota bacterium]|nr:sigma-54 dependent transcriptional regulator [Candidatus Margulisiibacteriota bacterium]